MAAIGKRLGCSYSAVNRTLVRMNEPVRKDSQHQKVSVNPFETVDTEEKAYWLGFLTTDGNVYGSRIQINLSAKDVDHLKKWCLFMGLNPELNIKFRPKKGTSYIVATVAFRSKEVATSLLRLGITERKTFTVVPWEGPEHLMRHYWRGCVDGDGWVKYPKLVGFCGNLEMVSGFNDYLRQRLCCDLTVKPRQSIFCIESGGRLRTRKILELLYSGASVYLERKFAEAAKQLAEPGVRRKAGASSSTGPVQSEYALQTLEPEKPHGS